MAKHLDLSAIPPSLSTTIDPDFGIVQDLSDSGVLHRRGLFGATYYLITLSWNVLTVAQRQTLEWFFTARGQAGADHIHARRPRLHGRIDRRADAALYYRHPVRHHGDAARDSRCP